MEFLSEKEREGRGRPWRILQTGRPVGWAVLSADGPGRGRWTLHPVPRLDGPIDFHPPSDRWTGLTWCPDADRLSAGPFPLPRRPVASPFYTDLAHLVRHLSDPLPATLRRGWPPGPVAVDPGRAVSGQVDLSGCLRTAMDLWNADLADPLLVEVVRPAVGVRLVFLPDRHLQPPLRLQLTRLDSLGGPLRMSLTVGNNYCGPRDSLYAVRGFIHELGHALLLWGHSRDRDHVLWERGPPLVNAPSADEKKAALLRRGLPVQTDWSMYRTISPDTANRGP